MSGNEGRPGRGRPPTRDDEVDLLIDAWSRRLPDADLSPLDVMSRLRRASLRLSRLRAEAFRAAGLAAWEFDVLAALGRAEPAHELNPAQLIERTKISSGAMTNRLTQLDKRGLVERLPHPRDGRSVLVRLTPAGAERVDAAMGELVRREEIELGALERRDRDELVRILRLLTAEEHG
ncbi:MarR family winged helix-turn-helix transcriptional regulator [Microbacterium sp. CJ88]|uniref:MarR family winged helix-turn-helix transcriptional regulator n=1 Tax=Microbacterium sp. CJ88 TaxID=3445672 RepID=UPI003F65BDED